MKVNAHKIFSDVLLIDNQVNEDERGAFSEVYRTSELKKFGINQNFQQLNFSFTAKKNTLRGLHTQIGEYAQAKLLTVLKGEIYDVFVNIDLSSPLFGKWGSARLDALGQNSVFLPSHYLHGFIALQDETLILYSCSNEYSRSSERSVHYADKQLNIDWPEDHKNILVSKKDNQGIMFEELSKEIAKDPN